MPRPRLQVLSPDEIRRIHEAALTILERVGVEVEHEDARQILREAGAEVEGKRVKIPRDLVEKCLSSVPREVTVYSRDGEPALYLRGDNTYFNPGSAAIRYLEPGADTPREPMLRDLKTFALVVDALPELEAQSTALVPFDAPPEVRDFVRLLPILRVSRKPIVTGAFTKDGVPRMVRILSVFTDQEKKPIAIFDVCPSPPLSWSEIACQNIIDCARYGVPLELIPMPQLGATAPVTVLGAVVQHHAEMLSGIVLAQLVRRGTPVIYGGSPSGFDMRYGTPIIAAPGALLVTTLYVEVAKYFGLPTHAYLALSDSKMIDYQAGAETVVGALIALLKGVNVVSGPGMLEFESTQSLEKLVIDAEIIAEARSYVRELELDPEHLALDVIEAVGPKGTFLKQRHTLKYMRKELTHPRILDRLDRSRWESRGRPTLRTRAREVLEKILREHRPDTPPPDLDRELVKTVTELCRPYGYEPPPDVVS